MNKENAHLYLPLIQALADGKTIEILANRKGCEDWEEVLDFTCSCPPDCYRIKPEPVMVPLGPEDVPPGSAIRGNAQHWFMVTDMENYGIKVSGRDSLIDWAELQGYWEIKRPGEDWMPCHKPA